MLYKAIQASGIKLSHVLERTGYHRSTYYTHVRNPDLAFSILYKYGRAIPYDFSLQFPEIGEYFSHSTELQAPNIQESDPTPYQNMPLKSLLKYTASLRDKYVELLEENRELRIRLDVLSERLNSKTTNS